MKVSIAVVIVLAVALWVYSGRQNQHGVHAEQATVQAQLTSVSRPTPSPTP
jgi:hypothetical protein